MNIDFPLILVMLTGLAGLICLLDVLMLMPRRRTALLALQARYGDWERPDSEDARTYSEQAQSIGRYPWPVEYARSFFPVLLIVLVLRSFLLEPFQIPSSSMVPTLEVGDYILVNKYAYGIRLPVLGTKVIDVGEPQRGDVMVFFPPHDSRYFIKRVIGLPGDRISYVGKRLIINGEPASQQLLARLPPVNPHYQLVEENLGGVRHQLRTNLMRTRSGEISMTVAPGHYFMMGDNRDNSSDSRVWGQVPEKNVVGKAFAIWMHWPEFFSIPDFSRVGGIQ